jgi:hypothetical protein
MAGGAFMVNETTTEPVTLGDLAHTYLAQLKPAMRESAQPEVLKFVRWAGPDRNLALMRAHEVSQYAESF